MATSSRSTWAQSSMASSGIRPSPCRSGRCAEAARLLRVTEESLYKGLAAVRRARGCPTSAPRCSATWKRKASRSCANSSATGGSKLHEEPQIPNYGAGRAAGHVSPEGMVLAIEPMVNVGKAGGQSVGRWLDGGDQGRGASRRTSSTRWWWAAKGCSNSDACLPRPGDRGRARVDLSRCASR